VGYEHKTVNHGADEFAQDEDDDDFHQVHINSVKDFVPMRSWLRSHLYWSW
jgi:hypothetical protein